MPDLPVLVILLREWIAKAENDLLAAKQILALGAKAPTDTACFHAQQCVEKYLKTVLVLRSIAFAKTHNIGDLLHLIPIADQPELDSEAQKKLTGYAVVLRYPDAGLPDPSVAEAKKAVAIARRIRQHVRRLLPRAALRRMKK